MDVTERYLHKTGEKRKDVIFVFNGGQIRPKDLPKKISEMDFLNNSSIIMVIDTKDMIGSFNQ